MDPRSQKVIRTCRRQLRLSVLDELKISDVIASSVNLSSFHLNDLFSEFYLWHSHLGHVFASHLCLLACMRAL